MPCLHGDAIRLYGPSAVSSSEWQVYNIAGEHVASVRVDPFGAWLTNGIASGIYIAKVTVHGADGSQTAFTQKLAIIK